MMKDIDHRSFMTKLNEDFPDAPFNEEEAKTALRNLGEFVWLLYKINEREGLVSMTGDVEVSAADANHKI